MSDQGTVTTITPTVYIGKIRRIGDPEPTPPGPTVPTVGQIWPRGNQIQK